MKFSKQKREIYLNDVIGQKSDGFWSADDLRFALKEIGAGDITIRINSPGGELLQAWEMVAMLRQHRGRITTSIEGLCASAATVIALSGEFRECTAESVSMIHNPWVVVGGDWRYLQKSSDDLRKMSDTLIDFYASKLKADRATIQQWVDAEAFFNSQEQVQYGFVHRVLGEKPKSAFPSHEKIQNAIDQRLAKMRVQDSLMVYRNKARQTENARMMNGVSNQVSRAETESKFPRRIAASLAIVQRKINDRLERDRQRYR